MPTIAETTEPETPIFNTNAELARAIDRHCAHLEHQRIRAEIEFDGVCEDLAEAVRAHEALKHLL